MLAPLRPCPVPRCPELTRGGRCVNHTRQVHVQVESNRPSAHSRGYNYRWSRVSQRHLAEYPLCGMRAQDARVDGWRGECHEQGRLTPAECTDHIEPHKGNQALMFDPKNLQSLCLRCNTVKAIRFEGAGVRAQV